MIIKATPLVIGAGIALTSDIEGELTGVMLRPGETHIVSDRMRNSASIRNAIAAGYITVTMDSADSSDFVAQVELNALAAVVSGFSGGGFVGTKFMMLDIHGGADTAIIEVINGTPALVFRPKEDNRSSWTITVPDDYQTGTAVETEVYWSPSKSGAGSVRWILEYKTVTAGQNVSTVPLTSTLVQPSPGTANALVTTGTSLSIPGAAVSANALVSLVIRRDGKNPSDTFTGTAQVHLVRVQYTGIRTTA